VSFAIPLNLGESGEGGGGTLRRVQILFPLCKTAIENEHIDKVMVVGANRKG